MTALFINIGAYIMAKKGAKPSPPPGKPAKHKPAPQRPGKSANPVDRTFLWIGAGLAILAFLLYANTLNHQYVLDDPLAIGLNEYVIKGLGGIPDLLTHHYRAGTEGAGASALLYRPLSLITFAIEWSIAPGNPFIGHLMNVVWYALTVALLFATLRRMFQGYHWLWAAGAALLFAVHPLHTEVVANIKSRDEILNVFFSVGALYAWARWLAAPAPRWLMLALGSYFLALLSKESAVTLLPVFPLLGWTFFQKNLRSSAGHALVFAVPVIVFLAIRAAVLAQTTDNFEVSAMDNPIVEAFGFGERSATSFMVLWKYFQLLVFPQPLLSDYSFRHLAVVNWANWQAIVGLVLYAGLIVLALRGLLKRQPLAFCTAAFLGAVAMYSQLFLVIGTLFGERLMYLPSLWFCAGAAYLLWRATGLDLKTDHAAITLPPVKQLQAGLALMTLIVVFFSIKTISRNPDWKSNFDLFTADSAKAPNSVRLHNGVGSEAYTRIINDGKMDAGEKERLLQIIEEHARTAIAIRPNPVSYLNLGNAAITRKQYAESIRNYEEALKQAPNYGIARQNIGRTYLMWGREEGKVNRNLPRAAELFQKAIDSGMEEADAYLDLGTAYGMMGQNDKAIPLFEKAVALAPQNKTAWKNLGIAYRAVGNMAKAEECAQRAK